MLLVGLGNPGKKYETTRHNIGWRIVDALKHQLDPKATWKKAPKFESEICELSTVNCQLIKPLTFMNLSGTAVKKLVDFYKLDPAKDLLVIHDDKDLPFGKIKLDRDRSSAGQKGVQNIIDELGTKNFARLRFGVGHEPQPLPTDVFILQPFTTDEEKALPGFALQVISTLHPMLGI